MLLKVSGTAVEAGRAAAFHAADLLRHLLNLNPIVRMVAAAAASQITFLSVLTQARHIDWSRIELFQLDEYWGLPSGHPARFRSFLQNHLLEPTGLRNFHPINSAGSVEQACKEVGQALDSAPVHLAFLGIGENGHLAFNDPPADFETTSPYIKVELDEGCRQQQVNEGWFPSLDDVPRQAITISILQLMKVERVVCVVPDKRKARAVQASFENRIHPNYPASMLRAHPDSVVFLDRDSASLLKPTTLRLYSF